jgi:hypothetical protein
MLCKSFTRVSVLLRTVELNERMEEKIHNLHNFMLTMGNLEHQPPVSRLPSIDRIGLLKSHHLLGMVSLQPKGGQLDP